MRISLNQQIDAVTREIKDCKSPGLKRDLRKPAGRQEQQYQITRLVAVNRTLCWLRTHEAALKARCPDLFQEEPR